MKKQAKKVLTEAEKFYVTEKSKDGMTPDEIAVALNLTVDDIVEHTKKAPKPETLTSKAFGRHPRGGIVVMTQAASEHGDIKPVVTDKDTSRYIARTKD